ncbi:hypothetical protein NLX78_21805 [Paenibacillus sp. Lou8.1]|nr:hypothetical protein [Paenibacillus sp. Lou8.1]MCP3809882.1 hypothetical protein [Paenibacillus sp. Lou8.1]
MQPDSETVPRTQPDQKVPEGASYRCLRHHGVSSRDMMNALIEGEEDTEKLAAFARRTLKKARYDHGDRNTHRGTNSARSRDRHWCAFPLRHSSLFMDRFSSKAERKW